jgi:hypothetical protein
LRTGLPTLEIGMSLGTATGGPRSHCGPARIWKRFARCSFDFCAIDADRLMCRKIVCVSSVEELERLSGVSGLTDIHRDKIDHITIPSQKGKGTLKRVEEVFDCWFESGRFDGHTFLSDRADR